MFTLHDELSDDNCELSDCFQGPFYTVLKNKNITSRICSCEHHKEIHNSNNQFVLIHSSSLLKPWTNFVIDNFQLKIITCFPWFLPLSYPPNTNNSPFNVAEHERKTWVSLSILNSNFSVMLPEVHVIGNPYYTDLILTVGLNENGWPGWTTIKRQYSRLLGFTAIVVITWATQATIFLVNESWKWLLISLTNLAWTVRELNFEAWNASSFTVSIIFTIQNTLTQRFAVHWETSIKIEVVFLLKMVKIFR